jgi:SAM-dependent methyltransferase
MKGSSGHCDFAVNYAAEAPLALAFERTLECKLLAAERMERPILDLGCGDGLFAKVLFTEAVDTGVDADQRELEVAAKVGRHRELICCYGAAIPKPDAFYQSVFSNSVLEHIPHLEPVLRETFRVLAPGGVFYFTVPADTFEVWTLVNLILSGLGLHKAAARYRTLFNKFWKHHHAYHELEWAAIAANAGFQVKEISRYNSPRIALANSFLVPFGLPAILLKKLMRRWVLSPACRRIVLSPLRRLLNIWLDTVRHPSGCLVFVKAIKPPSGTR